MKLAMAISIAVIAGIGLGLLVCRSIACRDAIGRLCGKGRLVAVAQSRGIYETDVDRAIAELRHNSGQDDSDADSPAESRGLVVQKLVATAMVLDLAAGTRIPRSEIKREFRLLQSQFDRNRWLPALHASSLSQRSLRRIIGDHLRVRLWISGRMASRLQVTMDECREFYDEHPEFFSQPARLRVNHLFLAAPPETPPEIVDLKKEKIEELAERIKAGENLSALAAVESEDERTKPRGGDLGLFSAYRMPADFFAAAVKLRPGEISRPVKTVLGFHTIEATELKPARQMTFEEARADIGNALEREKRRIGLREVEVDLGAHARSVRPVF